MKEKIINIADRITEYSLYGVIFFVPISNAAIETFFGIAFLAFVIKKILKPEFKFLKSSEYIFLLFFVLLCILSLNNSGIYIMKSLRALFSKWIEYILIFLMVQDTLCDRRRIRNAIFVLLSVAGIVGIDALSQKFLGMEFLRQRDNDLIGITASFNHYNDLGTYLVCVLPITICLIFSNVKRGVKLILGCLAILLVMCLLFTFSRGSWLGFVCGLASILILSRRFKIIIPAISLFIISLIFFVPFRERMFFTLDSGGDSHRFIMWRESFKMIMENPFLGKGVNTFMDHFGQNYPRFNASYAHNCYLQMWVETGIFSLISFLIFLIIIIGKAIVLFNVNNNYLLLGTISAIFGFLVYSFFDTPLYSLQLSCLFWYLLGITQNLTTLACAESFETNR